MEMINNGWVAIVALAILFVSVAVLFLLYKTGKIKSSDINDIAYVIGGIRDALTDLGEDTTVSIFAAYADKAVRIVEQMVKNGELEKENDIRKNEAKLIVNHLAMADGISASEIGESESVIDMLIEASVNEMQAYRPCELETIELKSVEEEIE